MRDLKFPRDRVAAHISALPRSGIRDFFDIVCTMDDVISLGIGEPDFVTPWRIREATIYALDKGHTNYTSNLGMLALRQACCRYVADHFGPSFNPETECIITVGVSEALDLVLRALLNPGDEVIYHEPCYVSYMPSIKMAHAVPVAVATTAEQGFRIQPEQIEAAVTPKTKVLLLNYPNNPTGGNLSWDDKVAIAAIAMKHDLVVVSDEIYVELTYAAPSPSIATVPGMEDRTVFLHGFSKAYAMTGYRIGYACGPRDVIEAMMKIHQYSMLCACGFAQEAALEAFTGAFSEMEIMREEYRQRRNVITKRLNEMGLTCRLPEGAFYVFPSIEKTGLSAYDFAMRLLAEKRVAVVPGTAFGPCGEGHARCSYATSLEEIETAMSRIDEFLKEL
ncbi:MAG: aminotransferase class I/II-fold pyridoxal phosphate-dependent enzyme [Lentisphaeria bacterium]|nr:aminotransferase class I/II-fold pyridoxal phosphate-dependent enzyme [Lentisphaeria bacterium]